MPCHNKDSVQFSSVSFKIQEKCYQDSPSYTHIKITSGLLFPPVYLRRDPRLVELSLFREAVKKLQKIDEEAILELVVSLNGAP